MAEIGCIVLSWVKNSCLKSPLGNNLYIFCLPYIFSCITCMIDIGKNASYVYLFSLKLKDKFIIIIFARLPVHAPIIVSYLWYKKCFMLWAKEGRCKLNCGTVNCTTKSFSLCWELKPGTYRQKDKKKGPGFGILFITFFGKPPHICCIHKFWSVPTSLRCSRYTKIMRCYDGVYPNSWLNITSWILP